MRHARDSPAVACWLRQLEEHGLVEDFVGDLAELVVRRRLQSIGAPVMLNCLLSFWRAETRRELLRRAIEDAAQTELGVAFGTGGAASGRSTAPSAFTSTLAHELAASIVEEWGPTWALHLAGGVGLADVQRTYGLTPRGVLGLLAEIVAEARLRA